MIPLDHETLAELTSNVFEHMLSMPVAAVESGYSVDEVIDYVGSINIRGGETVDLAVLMPRQTATAIASCMFQLAEDRLQEDDILDAVGEITNMLGGNVKGMAGTESALSLPSVSTAVKRSPDENQHHLSVMSLPITIRWSNQV